MRKKVAGPCNIPDVNRAAADTPTGVSFVSSGREAGPNSRNDHYHQAVCASRRLASSLWSVRLSLWTTRFAPRVEPAEIRDFRASVGVAAMHHSPSVYSRLVLHFVPVCSVSLGPITVFGSAARLVFAA